MQEIIKVGQLLRHVPTGKYISVYNVQGQTHNTVIVNGTLYVVTDLLPVKYDSVACLGTVVRAVHTYGCASLVHNKLYTVIDIMPTGTYKLEGIDRLFLVERFKPLGRTQRTKHPQGLLESVDTSHEVSTKAVQVDTGKVLTPEQVFQAVLTGKNILRWSDTYSHWQSVPSPTHLTVKQMQEQKYKLRSDVPKEIIVDGHKYLLES